MNRFLAASSLALSLISPVSAQESDTNKSEVEAYKGKVTSNIVGLLGGIGLSGDRISTRHSNSFIAGIPIGSTNMNNGLGSVGNSSGRVFIGWKDHKPNYSFYGSEGVNQNPIPGIFFTSHVNLL